MAGQSNLRVRVLAAPEKVEFIDSYRWASDCERCCIVHVCGSTR